MKRLAHGYLFIFLWIVIGITFALPFILTISLGLGFVYPAGLPFPPARVEFILLAAIIITLIFGLKWLYFPSPKSDAWLKDLRSNLIAQKKFLLLRFIGVIIAFPLFAFILIPPALFWLGLQSLSYHFSIGGELLGKIYLSSALFTGFIWLAIIIGKLCPKAKRIKKILFRIRLIFIDWVLEPSSPKAGREERANLYADCME